MPCIDHDMPPARLHICLCSLYASPAICGDARARHCATQCRGIEYLKKACGEVIMSEDQASVVEQLIAAMMRVCFCPSTQCESLYGDVSKPVVYGD